MPSLSPLSLCFRTVVLRKARQQNQIARRAFVACSVIFTRGVQNAVLRSLTEADRNTLALAGGTFHTN